MTKHIFNWNKSQQILTGQSKTKIKAKSKAEKIVKKPRNIKKTGTLKEMTKNSIEIKRKDEI